MVLGILLIVFGFHLVFTIGDLLVARPHSFSSRHILPLFEWTVSTPPFLDTKLPLSLSDKK